MHTTQPVRRNLRTRGLGPLAFSAFLLGYPSDLFAQHAGVAAHDSDRCAEAELSEDFDNSFNPAISLVFDAIFDWREHSAESTDGLNLDLRRADLSIAGWIDPNTFAWTTIAYHGEDLELDEAAIEYVGMPGNNTLRAGRFFVDFGQQMQSHVEDLRTIERPLVLREFLGDELAGEGLQWDHWTSMGDATSLRTSFGAFNDLSGDRHGHGGEGEAELLPHVADRKSGEDLGFIGRLTTRTELGGHTSLQLGLSGRWSNTFAFEQESSGLLSEDLSNAIYGADISYGWADHEGVQSWTLGGEYLFYDGDLSAELEDNGTVDTSDDQLVLFDDQVSGAYIFADHAWSRFDSAGVQYSMIQEPEAGRKRLGELDFYYTRNLSESLRLRFGVTFIDSEGGEDSGRLAIQLTGFLGPHGHGHGHANGHGHH